MRSCPTVVVTRGDHVESRHQIAYALVSADGNVLASAGDVEEPIFMRSSAKPLICAAIAASGAADKFQFTLQEIAIIAGSHSGEPRHVKTVRSILKKIGLDEGDLQCGAHAPFDQPSARALAAHGDQPGPIHNNCSGKHAGMLALAVYRGYDIARYLSRDHPAQTDILNACLEMLDVRVNETPLGVDGCGITVLAVPLRDAAKFYARLSDPNLFDMPWRSALRLVSRAMISHPEYVGGTGRFDTDLMTTASPTILCKSGAEGYHAMCALEKNAGMAMKVLDGNDRAVSPFVVNALVFFEILSNRQAARLEQHRRPAIVNHSHQRVGQIVPPELS